MAQVLQRGSTTVNGCRVAEGLNAHVNFDECPCRGPYQLTGLSMRENYGIIWANSPEEAVEQGQERVPDAFHAFALDPEDLVG